jgi:hypothetical protein
MNNSAWCDSDDGWMMIKLHDSDWDTLIHHEDLLDKAEACHYTDEDVRFGDVSITSVATLSSDLSAGPPLFTTTEQVHTNLYSVTPVQY